MHKSPLFSMDQLAELIEQYPREHYSLMQTGARRTASASGVEGDIGIFSGRQVIDAISQGGLWLNMRMVSDIDTRYDDMLVADVRGNRRRRFRTSRCRIHQESILISAPDAQVSLPRRSAGPEPDPDRRPQARLRLSANPRRSSRRSISRTSQLFELELDLPYQPWYDDHARCSTSARGRC